MPAAIPWTHHQHYQGPRLEIDPRTLIARHIGWTRPVGKHPTAWAIPEPDNYNLGLYNPRPVECPWLTSQVFLKYKQGWISVYYCDAENRIQWKRWMIQEIKPWADWHTKGAAIRESHTLLTLDKRKNGHELTEHEVLYSMNNYERLKERTDFPELIDNRVGVPGVTLREYLEHAE